MSRTLTKELKTLKRVFYFKNIKNVKKRLIKNVDDKYTKYFKPN